MSDPEIKVNGQEKAKDPAEVGSYYQLKKLRAVHHQIIQRVVLGQKDKDIAKDLNLDLSTVQYTKRSKLADVGQRIKDVAPRALKVITAVMESDAASDNARLSAAFDIMDRAGFAAPKDVRVMHAHITSDDIADIKKRAQLAHELSEEDLDDGTIGR